MPLPHGIGLCSTFDHARAGVQPVKRAVQQSAEVHGFMWKTFAATCANSAQNLMVNCAYPYAQGDPCSAISMSLVFVLAKQQRTWKRFVKLQAANMSPATVAEVLGVSVGIVPTAPTSAKSAVRSTKQVPKEPMLCQFLKSFAHH